MAGNSKELFKFTWTIENTGIWNYERVITSPVFKVEALENAVFYLEFAEKGENNGFCSVRLCRSKTDDAPEQIKLKCQFELPTKNTKFTSSDLVFDKSKTNDPSWSCPNFVENTKVFKFDYWFMLSGDVKIECRIFKADEKLGIDEKNGGPRSGGRRIEQCSALTRMKTEEISVKWNIEHWDKIASHETTTAEILSFPGDLLCLLVNFIVCSSLKVEIVRIEIEHKRKHYPNPTFVACKVSFEDVRGERFFKTARHVYEANNDKIWKFPVLAKKNQLVPENNDFLPKDILSLLLEFKICDGIEFSKVAKSVYGTISRRRVEKLTPLKENSLRMFKEQQACDVSLETPMQTIRAHKFILFANSSVFKAMFDHETLEKQTNIIQVADISFQTLERFLAYLYTQRLEGEVDAQLAMEMYFAADKYGVGTLKGECSHFLKKNLQADNVCKVLLLADRHQDKDLKEAVRDFFVRCKTQVLDSDEWKTLSTERPQIAIEYLQWLCRG